MESAVEPRPAVLVVEDEANIRELICLHLGLEQLDCVQAADGHEGLRLARERRFDAVILDVMLPGLDGVSVCRAANRNGRTAQPPRGLRSTGRGCVRDRRRVRRFGHQSV